MYQLQVEGMTCGGCAANVKQAVQRVDSHAQVDVDLQKKTVNVDTQADIQAVQSSISAAGYPVTGYTVQ
ncbi:copper chaperone [Novimethylophilus kurashikiensis]|uniref:Copper chaperone n=1 Tax=Novimethylophilus kurashikiensis TaxID=1825523 RepID=A0A2R5F7N8_9PROT|nr:heavy-metal-associated domain-containing protein [Novimethylophilus kurashikiensis]GBG14226.1 copper chaperone [Novimethylophilus kurashikiensis]